MVQVEKISLEKFERYSKVKLPELSEIEKIRWYSWTAGVIASDGYARWCRARNGWEYARIGAAMCDAAVPNKLGEVLGGNVCSRQMKNCERPYHVWRVNGRLARLVARAIAPYMIGEKKQIILEIAENYRRPLSATVEVLPFSAISGMIFPQ